MALAQSGKAHARGSISMILIAFPHNSDLYLHCIQFPSSHSRLGVKSPLELLFIRHLSMVALLVDSGCARLNALGLNLPGAEKPPIAGAPLWAWPATLELNSLTGVTVRSVTSSGSLPEVSIC